MLEVTETEQATIDRMNAQRQIDRVNARMQAEADRWRGQKVRDLEAFLIQQGFSLETALLNFIADRKADGSIKAELPPAIAARILTPPTALDDAALLNGWGRSSLGNDVLAMVETPW